MPVSVKDNFMVKGYDITGGHPQCLDDLCNEDAVAVELMKDMGAVPFCITNMPQSGMSLQCSNPIYGETS